ncbi:MAG: hypothetical protein Q9186_005657 [Xanthomendoza sp. 1 TL-2023]
MSGAGEERWRSRGQQNTLDQNQNPNQHRQNTQQRQQASRDSGIGGQHQRAPDSAGQGITTMPGNAWANNDRGNREALHRPAQEQHVPVNRFNAQESRDALKTGACIHSSSKRVLSDVCTAFGSANKKTAGYRTLTQAQGVKSGGPWASKRESSMAG